MTVGAIIQARLSSTRLPKKVLKPLNNDLNILDLLIKRISTCNFIDKIIIATSTNEIDKELIEFSKHKKINFFAGSEDNVLSRFYECATKFNLDTIIRVTADDPFKDPLVIEDVYNTYLDESCDYASNTLKPSYPEGIDVEIFNYTSLSMANRDATLLSEREHVTPYIWKNSDIFKLKNIKANKDYSKIRLTVDYEEDFYLAQKILNHFYPDTLFGYESIVEYLNSIKIDYNIERNEGYKKSLKEDLNGS